MPTIIDDETIAKNPDAFFDPIVDGEKMGRGAVERNYEITPLDTFGAPPSQIKLIPRSDWSELIKEKKARGMRTSDVMKRRGFKPLNQKSDGYCWIYSGTGMVIARHCLAGHNVPRLSAHSAGAIIKKGRNEGGWCGLGADFIRKHGVAEEQFWPLNSRSLSHDTPATRANMAKFKTTADWFDLEKPLHGQSLTFDQVASLLLQNHPIAADFMWWRHSVLVVDLVEIEPGSFGLEGPNSWGPNWNGDGWFILRDSKAKPDGAVSITATTHAWETINEPAYGSAV